MNIFFPKNEYFKILNYYYSIIYYYLVIWVINEFIQSITYDNYDGFQHVNFIFS